RTVTALCFHHHSRDVLAVGYGAFFFSPSVHKGGAVLFWSVRNPEYPERTIHTHSSVTSLDFAERHPTLLAAGMYDGTIAIYDTAREGEVRISVSLSLCRGSFAPLARLTNFTSRASLHDLKVYVGSPSACVWVDAIARSRPVARGSALPTVSATCVGRVYDEIVA
ncbi:unnamed protein product, partial [Hapterophycus canaliculatus]